MIFLYARYILAYRFCKSRLREVLLILSSILGVIGDSKPSKDVFELAVETGREIARKGAILVCGGLGGIMEGASMGAKELGGITQTFDFFETKPSFLKFFGSTVVEFTFVKILKLLDTLASYPYEDNP